VSADVIERQALSNLTRFSRSRDPIMKYDSLSTLISRGDVGANFAGLEHCRDVPLFPSSVVGSEAENRLKRLLSCVGMSRVLEWFLLFLATMASSHAEDRRLAKDAGEVRIKVVYALLRTMRGSNKRNRPHPRTAMKWHDYPSTATFCRYCGPLLLRKFCLSWTVSHM
jgi:hypothetical protein